MHYQILSFSKHAEKDNWKKGCYGRWLCSSFDYKITAFDLPDLIKQCENAFGILSPDLIEPNRLEFQQYENDEGYQATSAEMEAFKRGEIDLWLCTYTAIVQKVENADLTAEFEVYLQSKKG